jgi:hypothetical protein
MTLLFFAAGLAVIGFAVAFIPGKASREATLLAARQAIELEAQAEKARATVRANERAVRDKFKAKQRDYFSDSNLWR